MASTSYPADANDWRGVFIRNMTFALARRRDVSIKAWCPPGHMPDEVEYAANPSDQEWLSELTQAGGIAHALKGLRFAALLRPLQLMSRLRQLYRRETSADLVHVNWLQLALPLPPDRRPILVTVLGTDFQLLRLPGMKAMLRRVFSTRRTIICPNADWMVPALEKAFGDLADVVCVPFGIDNTYFEMVRAPCQPEQWLCVSRLTKDKIGDLFSWSEPLFNGQSRELHLFGPLQEPLLLPAWVNYHGPATQADLLSTWFPRATGLISLSRHAEGRPQVMLEAMASGLPIVASDLAAHRDLIEPSAAGRICRNPAELARAIAEIESPTEGVRIGEQARRYAAETFGNWDDCAARYATNYRRLLAR